MNMPNRSWTNQPAFPVAFLAMVSASRRLPSPTAPRQRTSYQFCSVMALAASCFADPRASNWPGSPLRVARGTSVGAWQPESNQGALHNQCQRPELNRKRSSTYVERATLSARHERAHSKPDSIISRCSRPRSSSPGRTRGSRSTAPIGRPARRAASLKMAVSRPGPPARTAAAP